MAVFRLLHASDLHIAQTPSWASEPSSAWLARLTRLWRQPSHDPIILRAFVRWVWENQFDGQGQPRFDALLITGDLATTGERHDLEAAHALVAAPPLSNTFRTARGSPTLGFWKQALELLPGNHDRYRSAFGLYLPGGRRFDDVFCPTHGTSYWCAGQGCAAGVPAALAGTVTLNLMKADFTLRSQDRGRPHYGLPGWLGQGRVHRRLLFGTSQAPGGLVGQTQSRQDSFVQQGLRVVNIWAIHFDPFSTDGLLQLLDSHLLVDAAKQANVTAILCGHTHESKVKPLSDRTTVFACGTTTTAHARQNDFQVLEIEVPDSGPPRPTFRVTWYRYNIAAGRFLRLMTVTR